MESICEPVLQGPWHPHLRVSVLTERNYPLEGLAKNGVAFVKLPRQMKADFDIGSKWDQWLYSVNDGSNVELEECGPIGHIVKKMWPEAVPQKVNVKEICWDENGWHTDIHEGISDKSTYNVAGSVGPEHRNRLNQSFMVTIPFPFDFQGPTVVRPWAGLYAGQPVQTYPGFATVFDIHAMEHRADRWEGSRRGLYYQGITFPRGINSNV